jgi:NAD kinase
MRRTENKIVLVTRTTHLEELVVRFNTVEQARFYVQHLGADFSDYEEEHRVYQHALKQTEEQLRKWGRVQTLDRFFLPNYLFGKEDTVVILGQDGLVANTLKYLDGQPVIAVNPDPERWEGVLLPFLVEDVSKILGDVFARTCKIRAITMAKAELNNGQALYGVNDLFIGTKSHVSAHYQIHVGSINEQHSSSGIIVSTGLGSTGWLKSVLAGAGGIGKALGKPFQTSLPEKFQWESDFLYYAVREPFPSKSSAAELVFGQISDKIPLHLISQMPENGVIFSDGVENDFLEFNSGTKAVITLADKRGHLVI